MKMLSGYIATCCWLVAVMFMVAGTVEHNECGQTWGLFFAMAALGWSVWVMSERRDHMRERSVDYIAEAVAAIHEGKQPRRLR